MKRASVAHALALLVVSLSVPSWSVNVTPGVNYRPHACAYYGPNVWEFGYIYYALFHLYVSSYQHYPETTYMDDRRDLSPGGAGLSNFYTFCTSRAHDVMFLTSHGSKRPATCVEIYEPSAQGRAVRDSVLAYWIALYPPGCLRAMSLASGYAIAVTQEFYGLYFTTPEAMAWWATCHSNRLDMTRHREAELFIGYDDVVTGRKVECDERKLFLRMNGREGLTRRPFQQAWEGINADCRPRGNRARLQWKGIAAMVLSPAVEGHAPTGIVCESTAGWVTFDCIMDRSVDPSQTVKATGDGYLIDHSWIGNNEIRFTVVPTDTCPTIVYSVKERLARSFDNRARLDGNRHPPVNAWGPNRDDFVWVTICPCASRTVTTPNPIAAPAPTPVPGCGTRICAPLVNHTGESQPVTVSRRVQGAVDLADTVEHTIGPLDYVLDTWLFDIAEGAQPGEIGLVHYEIRDLDQVLLCEADGQFVIGENLAARFAGMPVLGPGQVGRLDVLLENPSGLDLVISDLQLGNDQMWPTVLLGMLPLDLTAGAERVVSFAVEVPPDPPGTESEFTLMATVETEIVEIGLGSVGIGLPLSICKLEAEDVVPGNVDAALLIEIENLGPDPLLVSYVAHSTQGFNTWVEAPAVLLPEQPEYGSLFMEVPPDAELVGTGGMIHLTVLDEGGYSHEQQFPYAIEPAIEVAAFSQSVFTGCDHVHSFPWPIMLRNRSDGDLYGEFYLGGEELPADPPVTSFYVDADATAEIAATLNVPPDDSVGIRITEIEVVTVGGTGDQQLEVEHQVTTPVVVDLVYTALAGLPGEVVVLDAAIENRRDDRAMSGTYEWLDTSGWLEPSAGTYYLPPFATDTLRTSLQFPEPPRGHVHADSDSVSITITMTYDTGTQAMTGSDIWVYVLEEEPSDVIPGPGSQGASGITGIGPNPFWPRTGVQFHLAEAGRVRLTVHDASGRKVATLAEGRFDAGRHKLEWDGRASRGSPVSAGVYFVRLTTKERSWTSRAILIK